MLKTIRGIDNKNEFYVIVKMTNEISSETKKIIKILQLNFFNLSLIHFKLGPKLINIKKGIKKGIKRL